MNFSQQSQRFKILSDPCRVRILRLLRGTPMAVNELVNTLNVERTLVCHHLKVLRNDGMVTTKRIGRYVYYHLNHSLTRGCGKDMFDFGCCKVKF